MSFKYCAKLDKPPAHFDWADDHVDIALGTLGLDGAGPVKVEDKGKNGDREMLRTRRLGSRIDVYKG